MRKIFGPEKIAFKQGKITLDLVKLLVWCEKTDPGIHKAFFSHDILRTHSFPVQILVFLLFDFVSFSFEFFQQWLLRTNKSANI
jgi:hypothetical protein